MKRIPLSTIFPVHDHPLFGAETPETRNGFESILKNWDGPVRPAPVHAMEGFRNNRVKRP